jgi:hypothetical protein
MSYVTGQKKMILQKLPLFRLIAWTGRRKEGVGGAKTRN